MAAQSTIQKFYFDSTVILVRLIKSDSSRRHQHRPGAVYVTPLCRKGPCLNIAFPSPTFDAAIAKFAALSFPEASCAPD